MTFRSLNFLRRHNQCRVVGEVLYIVLVCVRGVGCGVEVLKEGFEVRVEIELGFGHVVAHFGRLWW
jgi:hypothetical protein